MTRYPGKAMGKAMDSGADTLADLKRLDVSDGIVLQAVRLYHGEEIHAAVMQSRESLTQWLPWVDGVKNLSDTRNFIRGSLDEQVDGVALQLGVWVEGSFAGMVGLPAVDWTNRRTSIGYWLSDHARGRGVMTTCVRALTGFAICRLKLNRVEIKCAVGNTPSRAIPWRLGFVEEGTAREDMLLCGHFVDLVTYAALAREWPCDDGRDLRSGHRDPATGTWTDGPVMRQGRHQHTATLMNDGRVMLVGGQAQDGDRRELSNLPEIYSP